MLGNEENWLLKDCGVEGVSVPESSLILKARAATEGDERVIYCEPSNEQWDLQNERVLAEALAKSRDYFLRFGNLDIQHRSIYSAAQGQVPDRHWEIGRPLEVRFDPLTVKGVIYRGESCAEANKFWDSLTKQDPPMLWFPSVGGFRVQQAPVGGGKSVVYQVVWHNIGFWKDPINHAVPPASMMPLNQFAKCMLSGDLAKALTAGYGTDVASLEGGGALRGGSQERKIMDKTVGGAVGAYISALGTDRCRHTRAQRQGGRPQTPAWIQNHFEQCEGMDALTARKHVMAVLAHARQAIGRAQKTAASLAA